MGRLSRFFLLGDWVTSALGIRASTFALGKLIGAVERSLLTVAFIGTVVSCLINPGLLLLAPILGPVVLLAVLIEFTVRSLMFIGGGKQIQDFPAYAARQKLGRDEAIKAALEAFRTGQPVSNFCPFCRGQLAVVLRQGQDRPLLAIGCKCGKCSGTYQLEPTDA